MLTLCSFCKSIIPKYSVLNFNRCPTCLQFPHAAFYTARVDPRCVVRLFQMDNSTGGFNHWILFVMFYKLTKRIKSFTSSNIILLVLKVYNQQSIHLVYQSNLTFLYLVSYHDVSHFILSPYREHIISRFALRFPDQEASIFPFF